MKATEKTVRVAESAKGDDKDNGSGLMGILFLLMVLLEGDCIVALLTGSTFPVFGKISHRLLHSAHVWDWDFHHK